MCRVGAPYFVDTVMNDTNTIGKEGWLVQMASVRRGEEVGSIVPAAQEQPARQIF